MRGFKSFRKRVTGGRTGGEEWVVEECVRGYRRVWIEEEERGRSRLLQSDVPHFPFSSFSSDSYRLHPLPLHPRQRLAWWESH